MSLRALAALAVLATPLACGGPNDRFCDALGENWNATELSDAISRGDSAATTAGLARFAELKDLAPPEISGDMRQLVDAFTDAVRIVTRAKGPNGETTAVDAQALSEALGSVQQTSQHVQAYADRECGIHLG